MWNPKKTQVCKVDCFNKIYKFCLTYFLIKRIIIILLKSYRNVYSKFEVTVNWLNWLDSEKYFFTDESVKRQITDSISQNLTHSDLESTENRARSASIMMRMCSLVKKN